MGAPTGTLHFPVVGIGASAGGLEAFSDLLKHLPADTGMAFVLVQHLDPSHASMLTTLLSRASRMPMREATDGMTVEPNHAYVIPPNTYLSMADGILRLRPRPAVRGGSMPVDHFFCSLAEHSGNLAVGVVLSGTGSDGASGLEEIKARGGITFAQDEQSATYAGMPHAAVAKGAADFVLSPPSIARELARLARSPDALRRELSQGSKGLAEGGTALGEVLSLMKRVTGADLGYYKPATLLRRLERRMLLLNVRTLRAYIDYVQVHPAELTALHQDALINVTGFFRDPEMLDGLSQHVFPALVNDRPEGEAIRIWVPGCSSGEEAYSLAIAFLELAANANLSYPIQIFGTDLNERGIAQCRTGLYGEGLGVSPERLARFFAKTDHGYQVNKTIRDLCVFAKHNLLEDPPFSQLDLVSCRNVLIYLRPQYQRRAFELFHYALRPERFLMVGRSEAASAARELFAMVDKERRVYAKKPASAHLAGHFVPRFEAHPVAARPTGAASASLTLEALLTKVDTILGRFSPPAVLIDDDAEILHIRGHTPPYIAPPPGSPTLNVLRMARGPLQAGLRAAIEAARREHVSVRRGPFVVPDGDRKWRVTVEVTPLTPAEEGGGWHFLVVFADERERAGTPSDRTQTGHADRPSADPEAEGLGRELCEARAQLESVIEELHNLKAEYRSAHEESLSVNEELQSTNEELETAKEELQSTNEELTTVNDELQARSGELSQINNDLSNVLSSVHMPIVLVDRGLRLRRFTPMATKALNVIASDLGRPISDITLNVLVPDLTALALDTMETMQPHERDVQDRDGRWYSIRVRPYWTQDHRIDGAVISLVDVDELRQALQTAREARGYAEAIVETVREPLVILDQTLRVVTANRAFYEAFKANREQTERQPFLEIGNRQWDVPLLRESLQGLAHERTRVDDFAMAYDVGGGRRALQLSARRIEGGNSRPALILIAIEDVTVRQQVDAEREDLLAIAEHSRAEAEGATDLLRRVQAITDVTLLNLPLDDLLHQVLARIRAMLAADTAVILLRNLDGDAEEKDAAVLYARAAIGLEEGVRAKVNVPVGEGFAGRIAAERRPSLVDDVDYAEVESPYVREKGIHSLVGVPLLTEGGLLGVLHVGSTKPANFDAEDVELLQLAAERVAHGVETAARHDTERRARAAAEAASRAKDEFLALLGHELRNPLSAVRTAITTARLDVARRDRALEIAARQSEHLGRLVDDLLDVARITQGKIMLRRERLVLADVVDRVVEEVRPLIEERGQTISVTRSGEGVVDADPARLEQIVENLLTNAAKYTPPGGRIEVAIDHEGSEAILRVRDTGMGIPSSLLPRIFDLFSQGEATLDRARGGLGIGLTVVRRLVELHDGRIDARSGGSGQGAEFIVRLPALPMSRGEAPAAPRTPGAMANARVLVVEDNADAAESMRMLLEMLGHRVQVVHDGPAALEEVRTRPPDVALVDIGLPGMDGYELVRRLRERPNAQRTVLVAVTGYGRQEDRQRALAAGFHFHVTKPVDVERLQALIASFGEAS